MKYERMTERVGKGICIKETSTNDNMSIWNAIERLSELEDKIENGMLIELPCKVGDTVYTIEGGIIEEDEVMGVLIQFEELFFKILRKRDLVCKFWGSRSVFLTKAEAEKRLEEIKGDR